MRCVREEGQLATARTAVCRSSLTLALTPRKVENVSVVPRVLREAGVPLPFPALEASAT